jgi:ubiquinone/menaquinone biosynthesis C-methylase UbiE
MVNKRIKQSIDTWDRIAESFHHTRRFSWDFCTSFISSFPKKSICADLGCGNGRHLIPLSKQCYRSIGFDISRNLLNITLINLKKNNIENCALVKGDLCSIPFQSNSIDHIIYIAALHNIKGKRNRIESLQEVHRILKPNGTALISVWSKNQERFENMNSLKDKNSEPGDILIHWRQHNLNIPRFYHLYEKNEFKNDLLNAKFSIDSMEKISMSSKKINDNFYSIVSKPRGY